MFSQIRHSHKQLRLWLLATAVVLLLTSVIEAGHVHGTLAEANDHCVLCQHSAAMDKAPLDSASLLLPLLVTAFIPALLVSFGYQTSACFALIRAPPTHSAH